jgi:hypothetical protein
MTNESRAFFDAVTPTGESSALTDALYEATAQLHVLAAETQRKIADLRLQLARADARESDVSVYAKFERFQQTFDTMERELRNVGLAVRGLTDASFQLDRYGHEAQAVFAAPAIVP